MEEYKYTKVQNKYERVSRFGNRLLQIFEVKKIVFGKKSFVRHVLKILKSIIIVNDQRFPVTLDR